MSGGLALHGGPQTVRQAGPHFSWPRVTPADQAAIQRQLLKTISIPDSSDVFAEFEEAFRRFHGREYGILFNSGTSALFAAFFALRLKPGENVIVPDYTFFATVSPLIWFPVDIRFCDCDASGNLSIDHLERLIDSRTRAVVITHMWGVPCDLKQIAAMCQAKGVRLIEDCSHAHGATFKGRVVGSFGDIACWSIQGQKIISGGEGGILATDDKEVRDLSVLIGHYGKRCFLEVSKTSDYYRFAQTGAGLKLRAHPLAIRLALEQFKRLDQFLAGRRAFVRDYLCKLNEYSFIILPKLEAREPSWYNFVFQLDEPQIGATAVRFHEALRAEGCEEADRPNSTRNISAYALFRDPPRHLGCIAVFSNINEGRPGAEAYFRQAIKLPVWTFPDEHSIRQLYLRAIEKVCDHLKAGKPL